MYPSQPLPRHETFLWSFAKAQSEQGGREYVKAYYHRLEEGLAYHTHDFYEINIVTGGEGRHVIGGREVLTHRGDVFVIPPHAEHGYTTHGALTVYHVLLSDRFMASFSPFLEELAGFRMLFDIEPLLRGRLQTPYYLHAEAVSTDLIKQHIALIEAGGEEGGNELQVVFHVLSLIATLAKAIRLPAPEVGSLPYDRTLTLLECMEHLNAHFNEKIDQKALAARCAMSYSTYLRLFKALTGQTPSEYLSARRIKAAAELLKSSNEPILSIALSCGFFDSSHFIREFKRRKGCSPSVFRRA